MKMNYALVMRDEMWRKMKSIDRRLQDAAWTPEGTDPCEDPASLLDELKQCSEEYLSLLIRIKEGRCRVNENGVSVIALKARQKKLTLQIHAIGSLLKQGVVPPELYRPNHIDESVRRWTSRPFGKPPRFRRRYDPPNMKWILISIYPKRRWRRKKLYRMGTRVDPAWKKVIRSGKIPWRSTVDIARLYRRLKGQEAELQQVKLQLAEMCWRLEL